MPNPELIFLTEATSQIDTALRAHARALEDLGEQRTAAFWDGVDLVLSASVRLANIFWPSAKGEPKRRARELRTRLGLEETLTTSSLRDVRNSFEHFDERIDDWASKAHGFYMDRILHGGEESVAFIQVNGGLPMENIARTYDIGTGDLRIFAHSLSLPQLITELRAIRDRLREATGRRW